jgi:transposase
VALDQKKSLKRGATVVFVDESGFDLSPHTQRGWSLRAKTPIMKCPLRRGSISAISAVTLDGRIYCRGYEHSIKAGEVAFFVRHLLRLIEGPITLIWDNIATHKAGIVKMELEKAKDRLEVYYFPPYAPELNPDEYFWNWAKNHELANVVFDSIYELANRLSKAVITARRFPRLVVSFYRASPIAKQC